MCTAIRFTDSDGNLYFGRNLDWNCGYGQSVVIMPRGYAWQSRHLGEQRAARGALVGMAVVQGDLPMYFDCANEDGLCAAGLSFAAGFAHYVPAQKGKTNVPSYEVPTWICCNFSTVDEVEAACADLVITDDQASDFPPSPLHWIVADAHRSLVIEQTAEGLRLHRDGVDVLTNQPTLDWHLNNLRNYIGLSNAWAPAQTWGAQELTPLGVGPSLMGLPGDTSSISRFVRAAYANAHYPQQQGETANRARLFRTLGAVAMVKGMSAMENGEFEYTLYTGGYSTAAHSYVYNTYDDPAIREVHVDEERATAKELTVVA